MEELIGIFINLFGSICISWGTNLIQYSYILKERILDYKVKLFIGYFLFSLGNIANFISFSFGSQIILAIISSSIQILTNVVFNIYIYKKKLTKKNIFGTFFIIGGCVLVLVFTVTNLKTYNINELIDLYKNITYIIYLVVEFLIAVLFTIIYFIYRNQDRFLTQISYILPSIIFGHQALIFAKSGSEIFRIILEEGFDQLKIYYTYIIFFVWIIMTIFWVYRMNNILKKYKDDYIIPVIQSVWTITIILSSGLYFEEFKNFEILNYIMVFLGIFITIFGIFIIQKNEKIGEVGEVDEIENIKDIIIHID